MNLFDELSEENKLLSKLNSSNYWGAYIPNQFYFIINTNKTRLQAGLTQGVYQLTAQQQHLLQLENLPVLFHEYFHYIQETSTMSGIASMLQDIRMKRAFMHWLDPNLDSSESLGFAQDMTVTDAYINARSVLQAIDGNGPEIAENRILLSVLNYKFKTQVVQVASPGGGYITSKLNIPKVEFSFSDGKGNILTGLLEFGRFYLYEGLAYELDREIDRQTKNLTQINDTSKNSEYTVLRMLAQFLFPNVKTRTFLSLAIISLQAEECGKSFIELLRDVKINENKGVRQEDSIAKIKSNISSQMISMQNDFNDNQDGLADHFKGRQQLHAAYSYIASVIKSNFAARINNPCFEVDIVFDGNFLQILNISPTCDYIYEFADTNEFMRDFFGSTLPSNISQHLTSLIAFDHYFNSHQYLTTLEVEKNDHMCPFFYCCDAQRRITDEDDCRTKPWRVFEKDRKGDQHYCWYGQGVGNSKGF